MEVPRSRLPSVAAAIIWAMLVVPAVSTSQTNAPNPLSIVETPACPKLNAHDRKACKFKIKRGSKKHEFQVWPARIAVSKTDDPNVWLVSSTGHKDGMFDHVLNVRRDDHITFQCLVQPGGKYWGPVGFKIQRGGVWATYGQPVVTAASVTGAVLTYFYPPAGVALQAGGVAASELGPALSRFGSRAWEPSAGKLAEDICRALAR